MTTGFLAHPGGDSLVLSDVTVPAALVAGPIPAADQDGLVRLDIVIRGGIITDITAAGATPPLGLPVVAMGRRMAWPTFVDVHTHLDKGHIWPRRRNPDGTFMGALANVGEDRIANWSADDVRRRMDFALRSAYAHGTSAIRTHIDSLAPQHRISWPVLREMTAEWKGRIALQGSALFGIDRALDETFMGEIVEEIRASDGVLGSVTYMVPELEPGLDVMFRTATDAGLDLDFHVDETEDPSAQSLRAIAEAAIRHGFEGRILVGHCCSLARQTADDIDRTLDLVARAGIAVVSLPMCNMYLQDRYAGRTPRWRGVTLLHEMAARGIAVNVASDNTRDPFYAYGDLDCVEVFREAVRILHLDHPFDAWPKAVSATPAAVMRQDVAGRLSIGNAADLVLFKARAYSELLSRPQSDRTVLRAGRPIDRTLPDYAELDDLMEK